LDESDGVEWDDVIEDMDEEDSDFDLMRNRTGRLMSIS
jgi:hypothetical protein